MARRDDDKPNTAIPEADRREQEQPADPRLTDDLTWPEEPSGDVDEADRLEQAQAVLSDPDEEYAPDAP